MKVSCFYSLFLVGAASSQQFIITKQEDKAIVFAFIWMWLACALFFVMGVCFAMFFFKLPSTIMIFQSFYRIFVVPKTDAKISEPKSGQSESLREPILQKTDLPGKNTAYSSTNNPV